MNSDDHKVATPKLDPTKLLGFRHLSGEPPAASQGLQQPGLAFNKVGTEGPPNSPR